MGKFTMNGNYFFNFHAYFILFFFLFSSNAALTFLAGERRRLAGWFSVGKKRERKILRRKRERERGNFLNERWRTIDERGEKNGDLMGETNFRIFHTAYLFSRSKRGGMEVLGRNYISGTMFFREKGWEGRRRAWAQFPRISVSTLNATRALQGM